MTKNRRTWEDQVRYAIHHKDVIQSMREKKEKREYNQNLRKLVPIPLIVGGLAAFIMYYIYGGLAVFEAFLTWVIGLTLIAAVIAYLPKNFGK